MKTCSKCGVPKDEAEFSFDHTCKDGRRGVCKICDAAATRARHAANPEKKNAAARARYAAEPTEKLNAERRDRYQKDPAFKTACILKSRLHMALKGLGIKKSGPTFDLLGCSIEELRQHLNSLFRPGMSWENHGPVWHIDHKRPCASFDLTIPDQQRICFHWTNLQPLFALDNLRKSDKYADSPEPAHC